MNQRQAEQLWNEILGTWATPEPKPAERTEWGKELATEDQLIAERVLSFMEREMVQGNPRRYRPALSEWTHRYRILDAARRVSPRRPHECVGGMVEVNALDPNRPEGSFDVGVWRPCEVCNAAAYEKWRNDEIPFNVAREDVPDRVFVGRARQAPLSAVDDTELIDDPLNR